MFSFRYIGAKETVVMPPLKFEGRIEWYLFVNKEYRLCQQTA